MKSFFKQFGGSATREWVKQYEQSPNWKNGCFQNLVETELGVSLSKLPGVLYKQLTGAKQKEPKSPIPVQPFNLSEFTATSKKAKFIWYGHSVVLMNISGLNILIDPMLGPDTTPIAPIATKRFSERTLDLIDQFPDLDLVLLTHDHYDHLDFASIQRLKHKTKHYFVALGVKRHLVSWGVDPNIITEFDWWDEQQLDDLKITFTPTRHFSGRGLTDRAKTLWGGWVLKTPEENIWFSGDGGYGSHFKTIGERLGPFDFGFMENGQYNDDWHPIHLFPHEGVQAALDANAKKIMPVHWAGFSLSYQHSWFGPADDFVVAAKEQKVDFILPKIGEQFSISSLQQEEWWMPMI